MRSFDQFLAVLNEIPDPRRAEGKLYMLPYLLLFSVLAVITGSNSFRSIETFIKVHRRRLNAAFGLRWKRAPAHTAIRYILQVSIHKRSSGCSAATPPLCKMPQPILRGDPSRSMARHSGEASTISMIARRPRCCTLSTSKPA